MTDSEIYEYIGSKIRQVRLNKGMSQAELAEKAELSLPSISNIELGKSKMKLASFIRIADALQVSTEELASDGREVMSADNLSEVLSKLTEAESESIKRVISEIIKWMPNKND